VSKEIVTSLPTEGGYFFFTIATTMATMVAVKTASKVSAANTREKLSFVVISPTPFRFRECQPHLSYVVAKFILS
jgi:hypothetical protein